VARSTRSGGKRNAPDTEVVPEVDSSGPAAIDSPPQQPPAEDTTGSTVPEAEVRVHDESGVTGSRPETAEVPDASPPDPERVEVAATEVADPAPEAASTEAQMVRDAPQADTTPPQSPPPAAPVPTQPSVSVARPSFLPMVIGGAVAAVLGYAAAWTDLLPRPPDPALSARIDAVASAQADLTAAVEGLAARPVADESARAGLQAVEAAQAAAAADLATDLDAMAAQAQVLSAETAALGDRVTALEDRPQVTVALSEQAQAAVEAQIAALRQEAADGIARVEEDRAALVQQADERFAALEDELRATLSAIETERAALEAARAEAAAEVRASRLAAAAAELRAALDAGVPYAAPMAALAELVGTAPPEALASTAEEGVPSLDTLRAAFPEAARLALEQTLRAQVEAGEIGRIEGFMRIQSGVRSLTPQEGDDADAVLSRAEAALAAGDLAAALNLIARLPDPGRAAMQDWVDLAETRRAALAALATFGDS